MTEKIVGTSFVEQKEFSELVGTHIPKELSTKGVPELHTVALLVPEPTNPYDATAVAVMVKTQTGDAHRVGYLARTSALKESIDGITPKRLIIYGYELVGLANSYVLVD